MSRQTQLTIAAGSALVALVALLVSNVIVHEPDESPSLIGFLLLGIICVAVAAGIFLYLIPAAERATGPANRLAQAGFATSLASLALIIMYWTALPFVLGAGGFVLGRLGEEHARRKMARAPRGDEQTDTGAAGEGGEGDDDQESDDEEDEAPSVGERAGQGWVAEVMGGLSFLACLVLFVIAPSRPS